NVGADQEVTVGGAQRGTDGAGQRLTVGLVRAVTVVINQAVNTGRKLRENIGNNHHEDVDYYRSTFIGNDDTLRDGKRLTIDGGDEIVIKTGQASITMKKDGTITLQGKNITIKGSGKIVANADGNMILKASKIAEN